MELATKSTDGRVVQGAGLKIQYRKMQGFEPLSVQLMTTNIILVLWSNGYD